MNAAPARHPIALASALDVYALVDALGSNAIGELFVVGRDGTEGAIFVERGRICWAAATGLAPRLTQLLLVHAAITSVEMEEIYRSCKARRSPLGEHLLSIGVLRASDLRTALLQHTVECLRRLLHHGADGTWCPHPGKGYSPQFTFTTAELLAHAGEAEHADVAIRLKPILELFDGGWGAAFVRTPTCAFPEPIALVGSEMTEARPLLRAGKWAASVLDVVAAFNDPTALLAIRRGRSARVVFRHDGAIVVGETGEHGPARILNRRARERLSGGGDASL